MGVGWVNLMRCTIVDRWGGVSFLVHGDAMPAMAAACASNPTSHIELLDCVEPYYANLAEYVRSGLAIFDERNTTGRYDQIHKELTTTPRHRQPVFRIVDDLTREASLRPVNAGAVIFNLIEKRIVQIVNTYREIRRRDRARVFDGVGHTEKVYTYRLPEEWALVP